MQTHWNWFWLGFHEYSLKPPDFVNQRCQLLQWSNCFGPHSSEQCIICCISPQLSALTPRKHNILFILCTMRGYLLFRINKATKNLDFKIIAKYCVDFRLQVTIYLFNSVPLNSIICSLWQLYSSNSLSCNQMCEKLQTN